MRTAQEALFVDMMNNGWFCATDGDINSPQGFFGWVSNEQSELASIRTEFAETIDAYGDPADDEIVGAYTAVINDQGQVRIVKWQDEFDAVCAYEAAVANFEEWQYG